MPDEIKTQNEIKSPVSDKPEAKKKKPILTILTGVLIVVLALLLLCLLPGRPIFGIILPKPKFTPIVTNLDPVQFQQITPPIGGGTSTVVFPIPSSSGIAVPELPSGGGGGGGGGGGAGNPPGTDLAVNGSDETIQIPNGTSANLTWDTENDPDVCNASGNWSGSKDPNGGSEITGPLSGPETYDYKITCSNEFGSSEDTVKVIVTTFDEEPCTECPQPVNVSSPLVFSSNNLIAGSFPEYTPSENDGGKVNISASVSSPIGGPCLSEPGPFQVFLYDNDLVRFGGVDNPIYGTDDGWSGNFPEFTVAPGSIHKFRLVVNTNCAGSGSAPIQSLVGFSDASMTITGPSASICQINQQPLLPLKFTNNQLVSGSFPEYKFTAFDNELVKVSASVSGFTGGPCLSPSFRVFLYDNDILKFGPMNAAGSSWSGSFPQFSVSPGQHSIKLLVATNCSGNLNAPVQSSVSVANASMNVDVEYPSDFSGPEICEQTIVSDLYDFGDAPDGDNGDFPSLLANKGARHKEHPFFIGKKVDKEADSHQVDKDSPNPAIGSDDGWDWQSLTVTNVNWPSNKPIYLNVLYDLNNNLKWDTVLSPIEHLVTDEELFIPEGQSIEYSLPLQLDALIPAAVPESWIRFTLTDVKLGQNYNGSWPTSFAYGETEDYSRPLFFPPTKFPPKPPKGGDGGPPPGGGGGFPGGSGAGGEGGGLLLTLPVRGQQARAVPTWLDRLLKFITANEGKLIIEKSSLIIFRDVTLRERPKPVRFEVIKEVREIVPIYITPVPTPEEPPVVQPPPTFPIYALGVTDENRFGEYEWIVRAGDATKVRVKAIPISKSGTILTFSQVIREFTGSVTVIMPFPSGAAVVEHTAEFYINGKLVKTLPESPSDPILAHAFSAPAAPSTGGTACAAAPNITTTSLPDGRNGDAYSQTLVATGGQGSLTWSITSGSLPTNLSLSASTGAITGTPTSAGLASFTVQVADSCSSGAQTDTQALTINVL